MKDRLLYGFAALSAGLLAGLVAAGAYAAISMGVAWLYVFGDRERPEWFERAQNVIVVGIGFATLFGISILVYRSLMRRHSRSEPETRRQAAAIALGALAVLILFAWPER